MISHLPPLSAYGAERLDRTLVHEREPFRGWTDARLVRAAPREATEAWRELFRRHAASVRAAAASVLGASPECEDIVAEVYAALWRRPDRFDADRGSLVGYLRMQARSASIDWLRAEARRQAREANDADDAHRGPAHDAPLDAGLLVAEAAEELWGAVARLPVGERRAIELAYRRDMTYRAVADELGLPEGTVKTRIRSGIQRLRSDTDGVAVANPRRSGATGGDGRNQSAGVVGGVQGV